MIHIKTPEEIVILKENGRLLEALAGELEKMVLPGVSAFDLEELAGKRMKEAGVTPSFLGYRNYPSAICVSVNEEIVHGIPVREKVFRKGDLISIDLGIMVSGFHADLAFSVALNPVDETVSRLVKVTLSALEKAAGEAVADGVKRIGTLSSVIEETVKKNGFSVVKEYVGHGIGRNLHEDPQVPNFGKPSSGPRLLPGMVLCLEPMVNAGKSDCELLKDGWTVVTKDGLPSCHFEDMLLVTEKGPVFLASGRKFGGNK